MHRRIRCKSKTVVAAALLTALTNCATRRSGGVEPLVRAPAYNRPYTVHGRTYTPATNDDYDEVGTASWYGVESGDRTSSGERFKLSGLTAAHRTLPIPSVLEVTNLDNGRRLHVRLNDRGPFQPGRLVDLSREAAQRLGFLERGFARVRVRYIGPAGPPLDANEAEAAAAIASRSIGSRLRAPQELQSWVVRVGVFDDPARASRAAAALVAAGQPRIRAMTTSAGAKRYALTILPSDGASAGETRRRVAALGYVDARVFGAD